MVHFGSNRFLVKITSKCDNYHMSDVSCTLTLNIHNFCYIRARTINKVSNESLCLELLNGALHVVWLALAEKLWGRAAKFGSKGSVWFKQVFTL